MRALVVDDSKPVRSIVARTLRELRFECVEAANGVEALDAIAAAGPPDLVTVNWHMPVMDGLELVRRLRQDPAHRRLPLLMISTEHDRDRIAQAMAAGVDDYLAKPFTPASLTRKLVALGVCPEPAAAGTGRRPIRVLVCDDSLTIRRILATELAADADLEVAGEAINGQACLDALAADLPDLVLLDVEMPVMDGITALRAIRRRHPKLPVVMFSSLTERGAQATVDALLAGANDYVAKPAGLDPAAVTAHHRPPPADRPARADPRGRDRGLDRRPGGAGRDASGLRGGRRRADPDRPAHAGVLHGPARRPAGEDLRGAGPRGRRRDAGEGGHGPARPRRPPHGTGGRPAPAADQAS
jgi:CheY-like chemotaxis protein